MRTVRAESVRSHRTSGTYLLLLELSLLLDFNRMMKDAIRFGFWQLKPFLTIGKQACILHVRLGLGELLVGLGVMESV